LIWLVDTLQSWEQRKHPPPFEDGYLIASNPNRVLNISCNTSSVWLKSPTNVSHDRRPTTLLVSDIIKKGFFSKRYARGIVGWSWRNQPQRPLATEDDIGHCLI